VSRDGCVSLADNRGKTPGVAGDDARPLLRVLPAAHCATGRYAQKLRALGVETLAITLAPEISQAVNSKYVELARQLHIPSTDMAGIRSALASRDGFEPVAAEQVDRRDWSDRYGGQLIGQFLVDR
jgi:hypothetical protein